MVTIHFMQHPILVEAKTLAELKQYMISIMNGLAGSVARLDARAVHCVVAGQTLTKETMPPQMLDKAKRLGLGIYTGQND